MTRASRWRAWIIVILLVVLALINWADKSVLGLVALPMMKNLHITPGQFGLIGSSYYFLYAISSIVVGFLVAKRSMRGVLFIVAVVWSALQASVLFLNTYIFMLAYRLGLGISEAPGTPLGQHTVHGWFPNDRRTLPSNIVSAGGVAISAAAAPALTFLIVDFNWKTPFLALAIAGGAWAVLWILLGRDGPLSGLHRKSVYSTSSQPAIDSATDEQVGAASYAKLFTSPTWWTVNIAGFAAYWLVAMQATWLPAYFERGLGESVTLTGSLLTISPLISGAWMIVSGVAVDVLLRRGFSSRRVRGGAIGGVMIVSATCVIAASLWHAPIPAIALMSAGLALPVPVTIVGFTVVTELSHNTQRAAALSTYGALSTLSGIVSPIVTGQIVGAQRGGSAGYATAFALAGIIIGVGGIAALAGINPERDARRGTGTPRREASTAPHGTAHDS